jgi:transcriptional regulator of arginine metabolism
MQSVNSYPVRPPADTGARRDAVRRLIQERNVRSQMELAELLLAVGIRATQATLSRDLKALRVAKVPEADGYVYRMPGSSVHLDAVADDAVKLQLAAFVTTVKVVNNLVLVRTPPGNANGVGRALDQTGWPEVEGTIAGDDTVLVITGSKPKAYRFVEKLSKVMRRELD